jgi:hypothetical protein
MNKNFAVAADSVRVLVGDRYCDLHNHFHLFQIVIDFAERALAVVAIRISDSATAVSARRVELRFLDVDFVRLSEGALTASNSYIEEMGYKNPTDFDHDWLIGEDESSAADHFFLRLGNDEFLRIHSRTCIASIE